MYLVLWNERASKQSKSWVGKVLREPYFSGYVTLLWAPNSSPLVNRHTFNGRICLPLFVFAPADIIVGTLLRTATVVLQFTNLLSLDSTHFISQLSLSPFFTFLAGDRWWSMHDDDTAVHNIPNWFWSIERMPLSKLSHDDRL